MFSPDPELAFSPARFSVPASGSRVVTVTFAPTPATPAAFEGTLTFHPSGCERTLVVEFSAAVNQLRSNLATSTAPPRPATTHQAGSGRRNLGA